MRRRTLFGLAASLLAAAAVIAFVWPRPRPVPPRPTAEELDVYRAAARYIRGTAPRIGVMKDIEGGGVAEPTSAFVRWVRDVPGLRPGTAAELLRAMSVPTRLEPPLDDGVVLLTPTEAAAGPLPEGGLLLLTRAGIDGDQAALGIFHLPTAQSRDRGSFLILRREAGAWTVVRRHWPQ